MMTSDWSANFDVTDMSHPLKKKKSQWSPAGKTGARIVLNWNTCTVFTSFFFFWFLLSFFPQTRNFKIFKLGLGYGVSWTNMLSFILTELILEIVRWDGKRIRTHINTKEERREWGVGGGGSQERCLEWDGGWHMASRPLCWVGQRVCVWGWGCWMVWWGCRWIDEWLETVETQYSFSLLPCCCWSGVCLCERGVHFPSSFQDFLKISDKINIFFGLLACKA